jgi:hypothetical protein
MNKIIIFVAGIAVGAIPAYLLTKNKYEKMYSDEINKMLEENPTENMNNDTNYEQTAEEIKEEYEETAADYMASLKKEKERKKNKKEKAKKEVKEEVKEEVKDEVKDEVKNESKDEQEDIVYIIPEAFGETGNETRYYYLYSDDILADEEDQIIPADEAYEELGYDFVDYIGEESDHVVHIRNNNSEIDYEIKQVDKPFYDFKEEL